MWWALPEACKYYGFKIRTVQDAAFWNCQCLADDKWNEIQKSKFLDKNGLALWWITIVCQNLGLIFSDILEKTTFTDTYDNDGRQRWTKDAHPRRVYLMKNSDRAKMVYLPAICIWFNDNRVYFYFIFVCIGNKGYIAECFKNSIEKCFS